MKHAVLGFLLFGTAVFSAQSSIIVTRSDFETPLLIVWGLALLAAGQLLKAATRTPVASNEVPALPASPVRASA